MGRLVIAPVAKRLAIPVAVLILALGGYGVYRATGSSESVVVPSPHTSRGDMDPDQFFSTLRARGFRVSVDFPFHTGSLDVFCLAGEFADHVRPTPGTHVQRGADVTFSADIMGLGSPVGSYGHKRYRAPNFIGRPASEALDWASQHGLCWSIPHLPPVRSSTASDLYSAYRVTAQDPAPGRFGTNGTEDSAGVNPVALTLTVTPRR